MQIWWIRKSPLYILGDAQFWSKYIEPDRSLYVSSRLREDCILFLVLLVSLIDTCTLMRQFLTFYHPDLFVTSAWVDGNYSFFSLWVPTLTAMEIFVAPMYLGTEGQKRSCLFQFFLGKCFFTQMIMSLKFKRSRNDAFILIAEFDWRITNMLFF